MGKLKKDSQKNGTVDNKESSGEGKRKDPIMRLEVKVGCLDWDRG